MISVSVVVTAPSGIVNCLLPSDFIAAVDGESLELIIVDGAENYLDQSRPGLRHLRMRGRGISGLMKAGLSQASKDWVLIFEDHGRPMPGLLQTYRDAIRTNPQIDLFSGALENVSSTSPWSFATFLFGSHVYWPPARQHPKSATNANLIVRRSALRASEIACDGGFMNLALPRLVRAGRYMYCANAVVDHVLPLTFQQAIAVQFHCSAHITAVRRKTVPARGSIVQILRDCFGVLYHATVTPLRIMLHLRGTEQFRWETGGRLMLLGLSSALGTFSADIARLRAKNRGEIAPRSDTV